jgi:glycosyltransferase involved in cell wall biosynthesis
MKVLNVDVTIDTDTGGGCAERSFQMTRALARRGVDCSLLILDLGLTEERLESLGNVEVHAIPCLFKRFYVPRVSIKKLKHLVKRTDIIHLMGHWEVTDALVYPLARYYKKPYVNCPAGSLPVYGRSKLGKRLYNSIIGKKIVRNASKLIAIAQDEFAHFKAYGVHPSRMEWIPNGINPEDYQAIDNDGFFKQNDLDNNPFILFVGRLNSIKGPDLLLKAFNGVKNSFPDFHLVYAGPDRGMLKELQGMVEDLGLQDRVHFIEYIEGDIKSMAFHAADLLVIPSRSEAMSIVVLEAGITGTPVLATDQCGLNEIAEIGGGKVVPASVEGIRGGLEKMLSTYDELPAIGARLKQFVQERFIWNSIVDKYIDLYRQILIETA